MYAVLAIEDNAADALLLREACREARFPCNLEIVATPAEGRDLLGSRQFDLVLWDMGTDPIGFAHAVRAIRVNDHLRLLPVIVLSGNANVNAAYEAGATAFVSKTADLDELFANIKALLHFWLVVAKLPVKTRAVSLN